MRNLKDEETVVVSGSDGQGDNGIYFTADGTSPGQEPPPNHMPVVPGIPGFPTA